ncbi:hypothetical protein SprV_0802535000 [Sparganum proliferum]
MLPPKRPCSKPHSSHNDDRPHNRCSKSRLPSVPVIPATTYASTTTTTTTPIPTTDQNALNGPSVTTPTVTPAFSNVQSAPTCRQCNHTLTSRIGLVDHSRIRCAPVPEASTHTHSPHLPSLSTHSYHMGLFGYMRNNNSGIHSSIDTSNAPCTFTNSSASSPINFPSTSAPTTGSSTMATDLTSPTPHTPAWPVTWESLAQRLANQCLEHQHTPDAIASIVCPALAHSATAWTSSVKCVFMKARGKSPQT